MPYRNSEPQAPNARRASLRVHLRVSTDKQGNPELGTRAGESNRASKRKLEHPILNHDQREADAGPRNGRPWPGSLGSIATLVSSSPALFFARLFGPHVESGYWPIRLPKLHIVSVDEPPGGFDGGLIINTIQLNHANGSVV